MAAGIITAKHVAALHVILKEGIDNLKRLLLLNIKDVEKQIKDFYEKYGENPAEELSNKNWQRYKKRLRDMAKANPQDKTLQKLAKQNIPKYKIDRLRALELDLQMQLTEATNGQAKGIYNTLDDVSKVSQATLASRMNKTLGLTFNAISANKMKQILMSDWSGSNWSERLWKDREKVGKKLTDVLQKGIPQGVSLQKMSRELMDLTGESFNNAFRLIRTETSHIDGQVTLEGYRQASEELGLQYYEYDAFLDSRTSSICRELNGNRFKVSEAEVGVNYPPMHPNCRSTTQLVLDEDYKQEEKPKEDIKSNKNAITPEILAKPYEDISQNDKLIQELKEHTKTLDDATKKSIQKYTTGWEGEYLKVNGILRGNLKEYEGLTGVMTEDKIKQAKEWINDIDKAMDKSPLPQNMKLYRGISHDGIKAIFKNDEIALVGESPNAELVIGSKLNKSVNSGTLAHLAKGSGVVNAESTQTLAGLLNGLASPSVNNTNRSVQQNFNFGTLTLPNVSNAETFVGALRDKFNNYSIQYSTMKK